MAALGRCCGRRLLLGHDERGRSYGHRISIFVRDIARAQGTVHIPWVSLTAVEARAVVQKAPHSRHLLLHVRDLKSVLAIPRISDKVKPILVRDESDTMGTGLHGADLGEVLNLLRAGALDLDALDLHAPVHVKRLSLEQGCNLRADEEALHGADVHNGELAAKLMNTGVMPRRRMGS